MNWENKGSLWHFDHVKPCASFNLPKPEQQKVSFDWRNLSPLRADKNIYKNDKRDLLAEMLQELKVKVYLKNREQEDG